MSPLSKLSHHVTKSTSLKDPKRILASCTFILSPSSTRNFSDKIRFLDETSSTSIKRGGGGRSSYSGVTATIFGASGFLGKFLCNTLGKTGTQMVIPYRGEHYDVLPLKLTGDLGQVLFTPYHICDENSIRKAVKHSSVVINLVGRDWNTRNFTFHQANMESAERIARISKEMGVKKFIHLSSLNSDIEHKGYLKPGGSEFLKAKGLGELAVRDIYPDAVIFRPSDMYGQQDRFIRYYMGAYRYAIRHTIALPNKGKEIFKAPIFAGDVAQGIVNAVYGSDCYGKTYDAVGPRFYELYELIDWFHRATRKSEFGYKIIDLKYDFITQIKAKIFERGISDPPGLLTTDRLERDAVTDTTSYQHTLEDLGVTLTLLEDRILWETKMFRVDTRYLSPIRDDDGEIVLETEPIHQAPYYV